MPSTKFWPVTKGTTTRRGLTSAADDQGSGNSKHLYAGRHGSYDYRSYLQFTLDWVGVGRITKATLVVYTDDHFGDFDVAHGVPTVEIRRLTSSFVEGSTADGSWHQSDYTLPHTTTTGMRTPAMSRADDTVNRIDITAIVNEWAPKTVKRSDGKAGTAQTQYGIGIISHYLSATDRFWSGWSEDATDPLKRPVIELEYTLGPTNPNAPTNLAPSGAVTSIGTFQGDFSDTKASDTLAYTEVEVYSSAVTNTGQVINLNGGHLVWTRKARASNSETVAGRSQLDPTDFDVRTDASYKFRMRHIDQEGRTSPFSNLVAFSVTNTNPNPPTLTPTGKSYASLNGVLFRGGTFSDPDPTDTLLAYQVQLSPFAQGDPRWDDADGLLWDTGKQYVPAGAVDWQRPYGGLPVDAGAYVWRARQWDNHDGLSDWAYAAITLTADFDPEAGSQDTIQVDPQAPWRIVIKGLGANRGPGSIVAILEDAKNPGASKMYNSPGELHFTLPVDHPQISVIEPKQTHYSVQFYGGDGWREAYAGLIDDMDATETDVVFYGVDYLGLLDRDVDERFDPANPDKAASAGGSKFVNKTVSSIVTSVLSRQIAQANSLVGFIQIGTIATMSEAVTIWSTMEPTLSFIGGLLDSHRQGTGKKTRIKVLNNNGTYQFVVEDDPGVTRDNLRLRYGELLQGYRVIPFGQQWASVQHAIGRQRDGLKVLYKTANAPGVDQAVYGRHSQVSLVDGVSDENDLIRRNNQAAIHAGKLGKNLGFGIRSGFLQPFDGYDICDAVPVVIQHGAVDTTRFGSGYWIIYGVAWEAGEKGEQNVTLTVLPREDTTAPNPDLIPTQPLSTQAEWQIGYVAPDPLNGPLRDKAIWVDLATGHINEWDAANQVWVDLTELAGRPRILVPGVIEDPDYSGPLPGGHNVILNSSFELGTFVTSAPTEIEWDLAADFTGSHVRATANVTEGDTLTLTGATY